MLWRTVQYIQVLHIAPRNKMNGLIPSDRQTDRQTDPADPAFRRTEPSPFSFFFSPHSPRSRSRSLGHPRLGNRKGKVNKKGKKKRKRLIAESFPLPSPLSIYLLTALSFAGRGLVVSVIEKEEGGGWTIGKTNQGWWFRPRIARQSNGEIYAGTTELSSFRFTSAAR